MIHKLASARCGALVSRKTLLMSCASVALAAAAIAPQRANAQAFQGTVTSSTGSVTRTWPTTGANTETIIIGSNTATINWSPTNQQGSGTIDFMPSGTTATFTSSQGVTDYTVLNRILPTTGQAVSLNGHVISTLQGTSAVGGKVWFYSPGGIVIGASAVFDVGGLLLTTNDVTSFSNSSTGFNATFAAPAGSTSKVQIANGAQINALQQGSYVALVAPRIEQGGKVRVNGQAAYAAAEQLTMTMNQGLFNIAVDVGTSDVNGVVHTGETSGPANVAASDNHKVYMVAVPKNQALTMLLSGKVGFDDATSASVQNGAIWLLSGNGINDRTGSSGGAFRRTGPRGLNASMDIGPGTYTSDVIASAQSHADVVADTGDVTLTGNLSMDGVFGVGDVHTLLMATDGHHLSIAGDVFQGGLSDGMASIVATSGGVITIGGTAHLDPSDVYRSGNANVLANGGTINVGGRLEINASAFGDPTYPSGPDATGGQISIGAINNGEIHTGTMALDAFATGGPTDGTASAGAGSGGSINIQVSSGSVLDVNGDLLIKANGVGGNSALGAGGAGYGGQANVYVYDGRLDVSGNVNVQSNGTGGGGLLGGLGAGGGAILTVASGNTSSSTPGSVTAGGAITLQASGVGGEGVDNASGAGGVGGDAYSGYASFDAYDYTSGALTGTVSAASMEILSNATGGNGGNGATGGSGGTAYGYGYYGECGECGYYGSAEFSLDGVTATIGDLLLNASVQGGSGGAGSAGSGGNGGDAYGGYASIDLGAGLNVPHIAASARAVGGNGGSGITQGDGGYAEGGSAWMYLYDNSNLAANIDFSTSAVGGNGNAGGGAYGGDSWLDVDGSLTATTLSMNANAIGGAGVIEGGYGEGGDVELDVSGTANVATINMNANGVGGNASNGTGGYAYGGEAGVSAWDGGMLHGGNLTITANATGGTGASGGYTGGGDISLDVDDYDAEQPATISFDNITLTASTTGSNSEDYDYGGEITIEAYGGRIAAGTLVATANGNSYGGEIEFNASADYNGSSGQLQFGTLTATANGGVSGGYIWFDSYGGTITADTLVATANGGFDGGFIGYQASNDSYSGAAGQLVFGSVDATANGGEFGGYIYAVTDSGGTIDLGDAELRANGASSGFIYLLAGCCGDGGEGGGDFAAHQSAPLPAGGGITATDLTLETTGDIYIQLSNGADVAVAGTFEADAGGTMLMSAEGGGGAIRAHVIDFEAANINASAHLIGDIIGLHGSQYLNVSDLSASQSATFTTEGLATFTGVVSAPTITVTSSDIDIFGGSLGVFGTTNLITLNALGNGQPIIIGEAEGGEGFQYVLNETDIETSALVINAVGGDDVHIYNVEIDGSQTAGGGLHSVTLNTDGSVRVNGVIDYVNAAANDSLTINAGETIAINTDTGGIQITNPAGALTGTLTLAADNIWVASGSLLDQLLGNPNFEGRNAALAANSGTANQDGFIRAGAVRAEVGKSLLVQNSGTPELFGGIDTGDGGLTIEGTGNSPAAVIAFGRQTRADGTVLTNQAFIDSVETEGQIGFTDDSVVNGCTIGGGSCGGGDDFDEPVLGVDMASILGPLDQAAGDDGTTSDEDDDDGENEDGSKADPSMRLINTTPINLEQQIDDPVTSGGDVVVGNPAN